MSEILESKLIDSAEDLYRWNIIDFNRLNGYFEHSGHAMDTIFGWFNKLAHITVIDLGEKFFDVPKRSDFPQWKHVGNHESVARDYWNFFKHYHNKPGNSLHFSDAPDFYGELNGQRFWGDIGQVSASAFALTQKQMGAHDIWISLLYAGEMQVVIESFIDIPQYIDLTFFSGISFEKSLTGETT
jgi:hypothetical protein